MERDSDADAGDADAGEGLTELVAVVEGDGEELQEEETEGDGRGLRVAVIVCVLTLQEWESAVADRDGVLVREILGVSVRDDEPDADGNTEEVRVGDEGDREAAEREGVLVSVK